MNKKIGFLIILGLVLLGVWIFLYSAVFGFVFLILLIVFELLSHLIINNLRKEFQWLITSKDELPSLDKEGIDKFLEHGFDSELGWARKPLTSKKEIGKDGKTKYHIGKEGARLNPGHENLSKDISCYGDSFTFARQVNDNQTWEWHLSELTKSNVMNFGVGNYGIDQALLRLKREYSRNKTKVVVMGIVPSTIVRILCVWKHYNEFGNTFGFKPRFKLENGKLKLVENIINTKEKFEKYDKYIDEIRNNDYFYKTKFKDEMIQFPYFVSVLSHPLRNLSLIALVSWNKLFGKKDKLKTYPMSMKVIMWVNLRLRIKLFKKKPNAIELFTKIVEEFEKFGKEKGFVPVLLWMPQKDDLGYIRKYGNYYEKFLDGLSVKKIDLTNSLINRKDLDDLYSDDNKYGGHYSNKGNQFIAEVINKELK